MRHKIAQFLNGRNTIFFQCGQLNSATYSTVQGSTKSPGILVLSMENILQFISQHTNRDCKLFFR